MKVINFPTEFEVEVEDGMILRFLGQNYDIQRKVYDNVFELIGMPVDGITLRKVEFIYENSTEDQPQNASQSQLEAH